MDQHLENTNRIAGVTQLERHILQQINKGEHTKKALLKKLLNWQRTETVNGFGDLQYERYLDVLHPFYTITNDIYQLNQKGLAALR